jgi:uncharacterized protein (AIM24 family)
MEMAFTKNFTSGFFGGEGFVLQSLEGSDSTNRGETAFLKAYGTVVTRICIGTISCNFHSLVMMLG